MIACTAQVSLSILNLSGADSRDYKTNEILMEKIHSEHLEKFQSVAKSSFFSFSLELMNHHNLISLMSLVDAGLLFHSSSLVYDIVKLVEITPLLLSLISDEHFIKSQRDLPG